MVRNNADMLLRCISEISSLPRECFVYSVPATGERYKAIDAKNAALLPGLGEKVGDKQVGKERHNAGSTAGQGRCMPDRRVMVVRVDGEEAEGSAQ